MLILGISCEHDSGAALLDSSGTVLAAINEERISREKLFTGVPLRAMDAVLAIAKIHPRDVGMVAVSSHMHIDVNDWDWGLPSIKRDSMSQFLRLPGAKALLSHPVVLDTLVYHMGRNGEFIRGLIRTLGDRGFGCEMVVLDHHLCHVSAAIHTSGYESGLAVSYDAQGDGYSSKAYLFSQHGRSKKAVYRNPFFKSLAHYYGYVTKLFGFKLHEHEGKVTGLSAFGKPDETFPLFNERLRFDPGQGRFVSHGYYVRPELRYLEERLKGFSREDVAAGIQKHLEENMLAYFRHLLAAHGDQHVAVAGGVFGNVLLNQRIAELEQVRELHVHPHMADGGLALGAAAETASRLPEYANKRVENVYWGPEPAGKLQDLESRYPIRPVEADNIPQFLAEALAQGKIVGFVEGRMEYGPRALCHRSILANAFDRSINDALNKKLKRTEFMPFAPIILHDHADAYLEDIGNKRFAMEYMTITCRTSKRFQEEAPAANHVDNTARPQLVFPETGTVHEIMTRFHALTNCAVLINTSFNMHGEPIVNTCEDAVRSFLASGLDYLYLNGRLYAGA